MDHFFWYLLIIGCFLFFVGLDFAPPSNSCLFLIDLCELFKYYDYNNTLSVLCVANIFSWSLACLRCFSLIRSSLHFYFVLVFVGQSCQSFPQWLLDFGSCLINPSWPSPQMNMKRFLTLKMSYSFGSYKPVCQKFRYSYILGIYLFEK